MLELANVYHSGQVEAGTCLQKMIGNVPTGVILKDVSMEVHGGELSAVLGSKGTTLPLSIQYMWYSTYKCSKIRCTGKIAPPDEHLVNAHSQHRQNFSSGPSTSSF